MLENPGMEATNPKHTKMTAFFLELNERGSSSTGGRISSRDKVVFFKVDNIIHGFAS